MKESSVVLKVGPPIKICLISHHYADKTIRLFSIHTLEPLLVIGGTADLYLHRGAVNAVGLSKDYM